MGRRRRPYQPGGIFHLTARTLRRERRFGPTVRTAVLSTLADAVDRSDARVLAAAVMSNHLHLVVQQGDDPLSALMQPFLRRVALLLRRVDGIEGPVLWRHFGCVACHDPEHARNTIAYAHLNPVRAGICGHPRAYPWTTHALYDDADDALPPPLRPLVRVIDPGLALPLFACDGGRSLSELRADYCAHIAARLATDADPTARLEGSLPVASVPSGQWPRGSWAASLSPLFHDPGRSRRHGAGALPTRPDMATLAADTIQREGGGVDLESIQGRGGGREAARLRHCVIRRLHQAGYSNVKIAGFLNLSPSAVSAVVCARVGR